MTDMFELEFSLSPDAIASAVGDETVILQLRNGTYFGLDAIGTRIWQLLGEGVAPAEICTRLGEEYDVAPARLEADVRHLLRELRDNAIVEEGGIIDQANGGNG